MNSDLDTRSSEYLGMEQEMSAIGSEFSAKTSFIEPEILKVERTTIDEFIRREGGSASERDVELGVARLTGADGEQLLRFFYRAADGRIVRGPLTLRPAEVAALALELRKLPALRRLVAGLGK